LGDGDVNTETGISLLVLIILIMSLTLLVVIDIQSDKQYEEGFKNGQIQAIIGNHHFVRETQPDSTIIWVEKSKSK
jgi:hypothetical protein